MHRLCFFALAMLAGTVSAQDRSTRDPSKPAASGPEFEYRSAFTDYRPFSDEKLAPWREANDEVGRVGGKAGHGGHAKPAPVKPASKPPAAGHESHR